MEFYLENGILKKGFYWGTSDEFEDVREGYRCGFFVLPMEDIKCGKDSVSFRLKPFSSDGYHSDSTFVKAPVNLHVRSREKALSLYQLWEHHHIKPDGIKMSIMYAASVRHVSHAGYDQGQKPALSTHPRRTKKRAALCTAAGQNELVRKYPRLP